MLIRREPDRLRVDVIDPHGLHLEDALERLQGLARFAQTHREGVLGRATAIAEIAWAGLRGSELGTSARAAGWKRVSRRDWLEARACRIA